MCHAVDHYCVHMLRIGVTGGIGSGKSSIAAVLRDRGAVIIDADAISRQVVAPGSAGLAGVLKHFGPGVRAADGSLDRAALARLVFTDPGARRELEAITHPLIWAEAGRQFAAVPADGVAVHDMPLLVEKRMSGEYHLVIIAMVDPETRVRRLVEQRGLDEADARARIAAQVSDDERVAAGDVLLDNGGTPDDLTAATGRLWQERIEPFRANLLALRPAAPATSPLELAGAQAQAGRIATRIAHTITDRIEAIGARVTSVAGGLLTIDCGVVAAKPAGDGPWLAPEHRATLTHAGFPGVAGGDVFGNCDPAWPSRITLRRMP